MLTVIITSLSLIMTIRFTKWGKVVEITNIYLERFEGIMRDAELVAKGALGSNYFWSRFWYLQQEQYYLWKRGLIE
jgi:hypothetical protein